MPTVLSHTVDATSPLAPFESDLSSSPGLLRITVTGVDEVLRTPFSDVRVYPLAQVVRGRWKPVIVRNFLMAGRMGVRAAADLGDLDDILTEAPGQQVDARGIYTFTDSEGNSWTCDGIECVPYGQPLLSEARTLCTDV